MSNNLRLHSQATYNFKLESKNEESEDEQQVEYLRAFNHHFGRSHTCRNFGKGPQIKRSSTFNKDSFKSEFIEEDQAFSANKQDDLNEEDKESKATSENKSYSVGSGELYQIKVRAAEEIEEAKLPMIDSNNPPSPLPFSHGLVNDRMSPNSSKSFYNVS